MRNSQLLLTVALTSALLLGGCASSENSVATSEPISSGSQESNTSTVSNSTDSLQTELPEVLHRMHDGTIITVTEVRSLGTYVFVRMEVFNDQSVAVMASAYFDLVDEEGWRSPNSFYPMVNLAPETGAAFNLGFQVKSAAIPIAVAFGHEVTAVNNEISLNEQDVKAAAVAMQTLRASYKSPQWAVADSFEVDGVRFSLNAVEPCSLSEGVALDDESTERYFYGHKIVCFNLDLTIENESTLTREIDPLLMLSLYDAHGLAALGTDTYQGPMLWATLKPSQKIRGKYIFATTESGPYTLLANVDGSMSGIMFGGREH